MTDVPSPPVQPVDEHRHAPSAGEWWNESWYFDVSDPVNERGAFLRFGLYPNREETWMQFYVVGRDRPLVFFVDLSAPQPSEGATALVAPGWSVDLRCVVPLQRWRVTGRLPARQLDDAVGVYRGEAGTAVGVEIDLSWETVGTPYHYGVTTRYEVPCRAHGWVRVGDERLDFDGFGQRDHSWGVRDWWTFGWCWSAGGLEDGTAFHAADIRFTPGSISFGYVQAPGVPLLRARHVSASEDLDEEGIPTRASIELDPGIGIELEPIARAPVLLFAPDGRTSRLPRLLCRYRTADGRSGIGWTEWNQVQP